MSLTLRLDQTAVGHITWKTPSGTVVPPPAGPYVAAPNPKYSLVVSEDGTTLTLTPIVVTTTAQVVVVTAADGSVAQDTVNITPRQLDVGTIAWDAPAPA